jgi:hypothetical protein
LHGDNWKNEIHINDLDKQVYETWLWLVDSATEKEILSLPDLKVGEKSSEFLHIIHAASKMAFTYKTIKVTKFLETNWEVSKRVMAQNVHKVKHWKVTNLPFDMLPNTKATWFIDPPYKGEPGHGYRHSSKSIDYEYLASWIKSRLGYVIACEGKEANYLPFVKLTDQKSIAGKSNEELVYIRLNT